MRYANLCKWGWAVAILLWAVGAWAQVPASSGGAAGAPVAGGGAPARPNIPPPPPSGGDPTMVPTSGGPSGAPPAGGPATSMPPSAGGVGSVPGTGSAPTAGETPATSASGEELVRLNVLEADLGDIIKQISLATGRNFILDEGIKGKKVTIISPKPVTKEEAYQTFLSALAVAGFTTVKGPAGVIKIVKLSDAKSNPIPTYVDSTPYTDSYVTRLIQLKSVKPKEMAEALTAAGLISKDGKITYYPSTNTLILTESGTNIDRLMKIIKELDEEGPQQVIEIIPVHNSDPVKVAQTINDLLKEDKQKAASKPGDLEDLEDVSRILPDERTSSIIVLATKRAVEKVRVIIARLDAKGTGKEGKIHVYYLKYAKAKTMAETLSTLTSGAGQKQAASGAPGGAPKIAELEGGVKVTADEGTNSLIVTASAKDFQILIDRVVSKLDMPRRQVYIECVIMELELRKRRDFGVAANGGGGRGAIGFGQTFNAATALGGALAGGSGLPGASGLLGGLISSRTVNLTMVGADGVSKTVSVPAFSAFLTALQTYGDTNIVSTPNILTVDNEDALIEVKRDQPIPSATPASATSATLTQSYTFKEAGLTLKIKPQISENNTVLLKVDEELSNFGAPVSFGNNQNIPTSKKRHITTNTVVSDGQTVVLGGLMEDQINNSQSKVPILGDIPLLGFFFRQTTKDLIKNNLLIFLTPHIMNDATDFTRILQAKIEQRNKFIEQNYGRKQRDAIKNTIRTHREDLLEFKAATEMLPESTFPKEYPATSAVAPVPAPTVTPRPSKKSPPPPVLTPPPGVITVPSLTPGSSASSYAPSAPPAANPISKPPPVKELNLTY